MKNPFVVAVFCIFAASSVSAHDDPTIVPLNDLSSMNCVAAPDFSGAQTLSFDGRKDFELTSTFGPTTACLQSAAGKSLYIAYELPALSAPYIVNVSSLPKDDVLLPPQVFTFDAAGKQVRSFRGDAIMHHGETLAVLFRNHPDERYLVVASDPLSVGGHDDHIRESFNEMMFAAGGVYVVVTSGADKPTAYALSHSGTVRVWLSAVPN